MNRRQRARRLAFWRDFALVLIGVFIWLYFNGLAGGLTN